MLNCHPLIPDYKTEETSLTTCPVASMTACSSSLAVKVIPSITRPAIDFFASFSPTASYVCIRMILALTALPFWYSYDLDATGAFISSPLPPEEQVYLKPIEGFPLGPGKCLKLNKTIYGLVQAPLAFFKLCKEVYTECGLNQLKVMSASSTDMCRISRGSRI